MFCEDFERLLDWAPPAQKEPSGLYGQATIAGDAPRRTSGYWDVRALPQRFRDAAFARQWQAFRRQALTVDPCEAAIIPAVGLLQEAFRHARRMARRYGARGPSTLQPPYVLFPLHYTDDAQLTFREPFLDQEALVRALARSLPFGYQLVVKPHPHYGGTDLPRGALSRMSALPNVVVAAPSAPPLPLLRSAACVATVNSTLGFEALVQGVPVLALGHDFYCHDPPCVVVRDLCRLPESMAEALGPQGHQRVESGRAFVRRAYANTVAIQGQDIGPGHYAFTAEDGRAVAAALEGALARSSRRALA